MNVFIVMGMGPSNGPLIDIYATIHRACQAVGATAARADDIEHSDKITDIVVDAIRKCDVVIADIGTERPNVYYEIGYAHALKKTVLLVAPKNSPVHFDVAPYNVTFYSSYKELEDRLATRLMHCKSQPSPIIRFESLPPIRFALTIEELRAENRVSEIPHLNDDLPFGELPAGCYGFTTAWSFGTGSSSDSSFSLHCEPGGTVQCEIHKCASGHACLICYVNDSFASQLRSVGSRAKGIVAFSCTQEFRNLTCIPTSRIVAYRNRRAKSVGTIADVEVIG